LRQARPLQIYVVIGVEVIQAHHFVSNFQQPLGDVKSDESCAACNQYLSHRLRRSSGFWAAALCRPGPERKRCETAGFRCGGSLTTGLLGTVKHIEKLVELGIHMAVPPGSVLLPSASMTVNPYVTGSLLGGELERKSESLCESGNRGTRGLIRVGLP